MKFLIKAAFWLGLVVMLLPVPDSERNGQRMHVSTADAIAVLSSAVNDIKGFCARNPGSCVTGAVAVHDFGEKAQYGAKILHDFISDKMKESENLVPPKGSRAQGQQTPAPQANSAKPANSVKDTLSSADRAPPWQGPQINKT